jgi:HAD superfamily hydrolase (TIGR01549 family)
MVYGMIGKISTIFFDFDGVLAESVSVKTDAFYEMYLPYGEELASRVKAHHLANGGVSRFEKFKIYNGEWLGEPLNEKKIDELAKRYASLVMEKVVAAPEVPGVGTFLQQWHKEISCFIITGTPTEEIREILRLRDMAHFFKGAYGSPEKKEYWVRQLMQQFGIGAGEAVFVGDALADKQAADVCGIPFILRQTDENVSLFQSFTGPRINDLTDLPKTLLTL